MTKYDTFKQQCAEIIKQNGLSRQKRKFVEEGYELFEDMISQIKEKVCAYVLNVKVNVQNPQIPKPQEF